MIIEEIIWISKSFPLSFAKTKWLFFFPGKGCQRLKETVYWQTPSETEQRNFPLIWVRNWQAALVWVLHKYSEMINMWTVQRNHFVISRTLPKCQWLKQDVASPLQSLNTNSPVQLVTWNETEQGQWTILSWSLGWWLCLHRAEQSRLKRWVGFLNHQSQNIQAIGIQQLRFMGKNSLVSCCMGHVGYKQSWSRERRSILVILNHPDHDVSIEMRDIQRERGETNTLVCCPDKVCLFWTGHTWPWPV